MIDLKKEIHLRDLLAPLKRNGGSARIQPVAPVARQQQKLRDVVGLEIGASHLTAAHVVNNGSKELVRLVRAPLPSGIISGGEVRDPARLGAALADFFSTHALPRRGVRLGLGNTRVGVRLVEIAGIEDATQLENAISFRAHELLSVPVEEAVIDYHVAGRGTDEDGNATQQIVLVVAYRDSIDRFLAASDAAGLVVAGIDLEAFALLRAVAEHEADASSAVVAVSIGHERTTLAISDGRVCQFTRVLEWGGASLTATIARALKISGAEAEELKHELSLRPGAPEPPGLGAAAADEALAAVRHELQKLVGDLLSSLRFYQSQQGSLPFAEVLVCGGTASMDGLAEELERELGVEVRAADPLQRVVLGENVVTPEDRGLFAIAIGLGIEEQ